MTAFRKDALARPPALDVSAQADAERTRTLSVDETFRRHHTTLMRFLHQRLGNREDAADAAQETYVRLLRNYRHASDIESAADLLFRIATNIASDMERRRRTHRADAHGSIGELVLVSSTPTPEQQLSAEQDVERLYQGIAALPRKCQQVFLLNRLHRMTYAQIAEHCGISVKMVEKHIGKALVALRARVGSMDGAAP